MAFAAVKRRWTGLRQARALPLDSERQYRLLFDQNPNPTWVFAPRTRRFLAVNEAAVEKYGYTREQFHSMTIFDIRPEEDHPALEAIAHTDPAGAVWRHRTAAGASLDVAVTATEITFHGEPARLLLAHDVTNQQRTQNALRDSEGRYRELFENANEPVATVDLAGVFTEVNQAFIRVLGYAREELIGANVNDFVTDEGRALAAFLGCDLVQGYHLSRPITPEGMPSLVASYAAGSQARDGLLDAA